MPKMCYGMYFFSEKKKKKKKKKKKHKYLQEYGSYL